MRTNLGDKHVDYNISIERKLKKWILPKFTVLAKNCWYLLTTLNFSGNFQTGQNSRFSQQFVFF